MDMESLLDFIVNIAYDIDVGISAGRVQALRNFLAEVTAMMTVHRQQFPQTPQGILDALMRRVVKRMLFIAALSGQVDVVRMLCAERHATGLDNTMKIATRHNHQAVVALLRDEYHVNTPGQ